MSTPLSLAFPTQSRPRHGMLSHCTRLRLWVISVGGCRWGWMRIPATREQATRASNQFESATAPRLGLELPLSGCSRRVRNPRREPCDQRAAASLFSRRAQRQGFRGVPRQEGAQDESGEVPDERRGRQCALHVDEFADKKARLKAQPLMTGPVPPAVSARLHSRRRVAPATNSRIPSDAEPAGSVS